MLAPRRDRPLSTRPSVAFSLMMMRMNPQIVGNTVVGLGPTFASVHNFKFMAGNDGHIEPLRLFNLARGSGSRIIAEESKHLHECKECPPVLKVFARQFDRPWIEEIETNGKPEDAA